MIKWQQLYYMQTGYVNLEMINTELSIRHQTTDIPQQMTRMIKGKKTYGEEETRLLLI